MTRFEFYLSDEDTDRLFFLKEKAGNATDTANDFAKDILTRELYRMQPKVPQIDENGNYYE